jgi:methylphosphotriester-DNA--protein-cysteine methyltransferase
MNLDADACWKALSARDARFDGRFYVGVATTGIYCRPVCNVRMPRRENCRFFASAEPPRRAVSARACAVVPSSRRATRRSTPARGSRKARST